MGIDRSFVCNEAHLPYVNPTGYCNPELDHIALEAGSVPTEQRRVLYKQYAEIVARDLNELTLTNAPTFHAVATKFKTSTHSSISLSTRRRAGPMSGCRRTRGEAGEPPGGRPAGAS